MSPENRADLRRVLSERMVAMAVMKRREQQATFQVLDARQKSDAAACGSMTELIVNIHGRHWPLLGRNTVHRRRI
jgi:hypothetical protein